MKMVAYDPCGANFLRMGRHDPAETRCHLWWSGSGIRMNIDCTALEVEAESTAKDHAQWLGVMIDGAPVARFVLMQGVHRYPVLAGMEAGVSHEVTILRDTQPSYDEDAPVILHAVYTDGKPSAPEARPLRLEFIGDSLTVGEGCVGPESADEWRMAWISHMPTFATLVSEKLHAEKQVVALGGWGASRSWDNDVNSRIGRIYDQLSAVTPGGDVPYAEPDAPVDAVVINLGTNDGSGLAKIPEAERAEAEEALVRDAAGLLRQVRARHPKAYILWAYGMCGHAVEPMLQKAVELRKQEGDGRVAYYHLSEAKSLGSRLHPSREAHRVTAGEIAEALEEALRLKK